MNSSNITSPVHCPNYDWYQSAGRIVDYITYHVFVYVYFILGLFFHTVYLVFFYKKSKSEKTYVYQVYNSVTEIMGILSVTAYSVTVATWSIPLFPDKAGPTWWLGCYPCMYFSAHISLPLLSVSLFMSAWCVVCMNIDRLHALWRPISYSAYHKRNRIVALVIGVVFPLALNVFNFFRFTLSPYEQNGVIMYKMISDVKFISSATGAALNNLNNAARVIILITLYFCTAVLVWKYRQQKAKLSRNASKANADTRKDKTIKMLTLITISQSCCATLGITGMIALSVTMALDPSFYPCQGAFYSPLTTLANQITALCDIAACYVISKQFRNALGQVICCKTSAVGPGPT